MTPQRDLSDSEDERAAGHLLFRLWKTPQAWAVLSTLLLGAGGYREMTRPKEADLKAFRAILKEEVRPLRAGIEALASAQSDKTQVKVFRAMMLAERREEPK